MGSLNQLIHLVYWWYVDWENETILKQTDEFFGWGCRILIRESPFVLFINLDCYPRYVSVSELGNDLLWVVCMTLFSNPHDVAVSVVRLRDRFVENVICHPLHVFFWSIHYCSHLEKCILVPLLAGIADTLCLSIIAWIGDFDLLSCSGERVHCVGPCLDTHDQWIERTVSWPIVCASSYRAHIVSLCSGKDLETAMWRSLP